MSILQMIMPIGLDARFEEKIGIIRSLANEYQFQVRLPIPTQDEPCFSIKKVVNEFKDAKIVIADLSFERPSCYYELGIAETLGLETYVICASETHVHQTSKKNHVVFYEDLADYKKALVDVIAKSRLIGLAVDETCD